MALIQCTECSREISDRASNCPGCGAPVAVETPAAPPTVIEQTSKTWKGHMLLGIGMAVIGFLIITFSVIGSNGRPNAFSWFGFAAIVVGFLWFVVALIAAWWHHG